MDWDDEEEEMQLGSLLRGAPPSVKREASELADALAVEGYGLRSVRRAVVELLSPPRVTAELKNMLNIMPSIPLKPGATFDYPWMNTG